MIDAIQKFAALAGKIWYFDGDGVFHFDDNQMLESIFSDAPPPDPMWYFVTTQGRLNGNVGQYIFNTMTQQSAVKDVYNDLHMITTSPEWALYIAHDTNYASIENPNEQGFLGYRKTFFQQDGIFGSDISLLKMINHYKRLFRPPIVVQFETYGQPILPFDVVSLNGQSLFVTSVTSEIDAQKNVYWQTINAEYWVGQNGSSELVI
jgi:hypothetical protein